MTLSLHPPADVPPDSALKVLVRRCSELESAHRVLGRRSLVPKLESNPVVLPLWPYGTGLFPVTRRTAFTSFTLNLLAPQTPLWFGLFSEQTVICKCPS